MEDVTWLVGKIRITFVGPVPNAEPPRIECSDIKLDSLGAHVIQQRDEPISRW